ncbi:uncharacterized protein LOC143329298 [Chaetodon auriga]|uniref:uncharacterized protein LOC143329298 n=1 Tax=Chaetodon auriga TaxID=39042 RepID=UPI004032C02E
MCAVCCQRSTQVSTEKTETEEKFHCRSDPRSQSRFLRENQDQERSGSTSRVSLLDTNLADSCFRLFSSSAMDKSVLLVLLCLQAFLLITAFTSTDAAAQGRYGNQQLRLGQTQTGDEGVRMIKWKKKYWPKPGAHGPLRRN